MRTSKCSTTKYFHLGWQGAGHFLFQRDPKKRNKVENFRSKSFCLTMWELFTGITSNNIYNYLDNNEILSNKEKGCIRNIRGSKYQLIID